MRLNFTRIQSVVCTLTKKMKTQQHKPTSTETHPNKTEHKQHPCRIAKRSKLNYCLIAILGATEEKQKRQRTKNPIQERQTPTNTHTTNKQTPKEPWWWVLVKEPFTLPFAQLSYHIPGSNLALAASHGDGNCFPRSLSTLVYGSQEHHKEMRGRIV